MEVEATVRFGIIGWGYWGPNIARNLASLAAVSVTIVADADPMRFRCEAPDHVCWRSTTNIEEVWQADIDAVVIATPAQTHYRLAREALLHGKHVLVEKPLTTSVAEAEELVTLANDLKLILMVGHTFEYNPAVVELRRLIESGELGRIYCVDAERVNLGVFRHDTNVLWDLAAHDISILLYLFGQLPHSLHVQAQAHLQSHIHDTAHLHLSFIDGMSAHVHVSWLHPCKIRRITIIGDLRMVVYDDTNPSERIKIYNKGADVHVDPVVSYRYGAVTIPYIHWVEPLRLECEDLVHAIRTGEAPRANGQVGLQVVRVLAAAQTIMERQGEQNCIVEVN